MGYGTDGYGWRPYVPVWKRRERATKEVQRLVEKGRQVAPVAIEGRQIATTFWGRAWCDNLESYSDHENRLPRGRTYVRNGSVMDLQVKPGKVTGLVSGSMGLYEIDVAIRPLGAARWRAIVAECSGKIGSVVELLAGRLADGVLELLARPGKGLFPEPAEMTFSCSCPDWADMCKHVAAVLYGVGARLDARPELFFVLRQVDQLDLVTAAGSAGMLGKANPGRATLTTAQLGDVFGIELDEAPARTERKVRPGRTAKPVKPAKVARPARAAKPAKPGRRAKDRPARSLRSTVGKHLDQLARSIRLTVQASLDDPPRRSPGKLARRRARC